MARYKVIRKPDAYHEVGDVVEENANSAILVREGILAPIPDDAPPVNETPESVPAQAVETEATVEVEPKALTRKATGRRRGGKTSAG